MLLYSFNKTYCLFYEFLPFFQSTQNYSTEWQRQFAFFCFVFLIRVFGSEWLEEQKDQVEIIQSQAPNSEPDTIYEAC